MNRCIPRILGLLLLIPALAASVMAAELAGVTPEELKQIQ
jgi:hypothetical protein